VKDGERGFKGPRGRGFKCKAKKKGFEGSRVQVNNAARGFRRGRGANYFRLGILGLRIAEFGFEHLKFEFVSYFGISIFGFNKTSVLTK
jgi:hypothetical protein